MAKERAEVSEMFDDLKRLGEMRDRGEVTG